MLGSHGRCFYGLCGTRGVVLEALGRFEEAVRDYNSVLAVQPNDPAAWNNLGNATRGLGLWQVCNISLPRSPTIVFSFPRFHTKRW